jgi:hypothetical protein
LLNILNKIQIQRVSRQRIAREIVLGDGCELISPEFDESLGTSLFDE